MMTMLCFKNIHKCEAVVDVVKQWSTLVEECRLQIRYSSGLLQVILSKSAYARSSLYPVWNGKRVAVSLRGLFTFHSVIYVVS